MSWFSNLTKSISRPIKKAARTAYNNPVTRTVSRPVKFVGRAAINNPIVNNRLTRAVSRPVKRLSHNPAVRAGLLVGTAATGGLLAPVALGVSGVATAQNVAKHGVVEGLKRTASEEIAARDPRRVVAAAQKALPKPLQSTKYTAQLVQAGFEAIPGGATAMKAADKGYALLSGNPKAIVQAASAGLNMSGGAALEHAAAVQSAINKLPPHLRKQVAAAANVVKSTHNQVSLALATQLKNGMSGVLVVPGKRGVQGKYKKLASGGTKGFLLTSNGRIHIGSFGKV